MPQTTGTVPQSCGKVEFSTVSTCDSWTNVSGSVNSILAPTQTKMVGEEYTFDGDGAIVLVGKLEPFDLTVRIVYTEEALEAYIIEKTQFELGACNGYMCLRWSPAGGNVGDIQYTTNYAPITSHSWPPINAGAAGPIMVEFTMRVSTVTESLVTS